MKRYELTEFQANAILEMQLRRLAALERKKIETEYKETLGLIKDLEGLLKSPKKMRGLASEELVQVKAAYGDRRRTQIVSMHGRKASKKAPLTTAELVKEHVVWIGMTADGTMARTRDESRHAFPAPMRRNCWSKPTPRIHSIWLPSVDCVRRWPSIPCRKPKNWRMVILSTNSRPSRPDEMPVAAFALPARKSELPEETCLLTVTRGGMVKKSFSSASYPALRRRPSDWSMSTMATHLVGLF